MSKSILSNDHECFVCHDTRNLDRHHIYGGSRRQTSDDYGFWVYLCRYHHTWSNESVHSGDKTLDHKLKRWCQKKFEETHTRDEFMQLIGRNYLDD